jgi:hypothetical protein
MLGCRWGFACDSCDVCPIVGRRYNCEHCSNQGGFDLCGACFDGGMAGVAGLYQYHSPQHRMVKVSC